MECEKSILRVPICTEIDAAMYNTTNEHAYDPYVLAEEKSKVVIDKRWWQSLTNYARKLIAIRLCGALTVSEEVKVPHEVEQCALLNVVYQAYIDSFDYQIWHKAMACSNEELGGGVRLIHLSMPVKMLLLTIYLREVTLSEKREELLALKEAIEREMEEDTEYFVRLSCTSGKNEKSVRPFRTADEIIAHLCAVRLFATREYSRDKDTFLVLVPWNDAIDERNEFRLFVVARRLTAASPQHCFAYHHYTSEELEAIQQALADIKWFERAPYETFVADVWIDFDARLCHLIELNVFGAHSGAGSSLFNWITDYDVLHGISAPQLRYRSFIDY
jgi:hypothetical protein